MRFLNQLSFQLLWHPVSAALLLWLAWLWMKSKLKDIQQGEKPGQKVRQFCTIFFL
jgi:hypothetical protein